MKSLLIFLAFNVVLLICCYEKKCARSQSETVDIDRFSMPDPAETEFNANGDNIQKLDARLHIVITNGFVKGHYSGPDFQEYTRVVGAINGRDEMMLIESEKGKITRTFHGKFQKKGEKLMLLKGIWKDAESAAPARFSDKVLARF